MTASSRKDTIDTVTRAASADPDPGWRLTEVSDLAGRLAGEVATAGTGFRLLAVSAAVDLDRLVVARMSHIAREPAECLPQTHRDGVDA